MRYEIVSPGAFSAAKVYLEKGESLNMDPGVMITMDESIDLVGKITGGGIFNMIRRTMTGESARVQTATAKKSGGEIVIAPSQPGEICAKDLDKDEHLLLVHGAYLASAGSVSFNVKMQGPIKAMLSGSNIMAQQLTGPGLVIFSGFGAVMHKALKSGEVYMVNNEHLIGWSSTAKYSVVKSSRGLLSSYLSEGLVCRFEGPGDVYVQTRGAGALAEVLAPYFKQSANQKDIETENTEEEN